MINWLDIRNSENISFDGIVFDYIASNNPWESQRPFTIDQSVNIEIINSIFDGDLASGTNSTVDGYGTGIGLYVKYSDGINISGNEFYQWFRGAFYQDSQNVTIRQNDVHSNRSDGFNLANVDDLLIEGNYFHDFIAASQTGDHPDYIQFWTTNTSSPSENVVIRRNAFATGQGDDAQAIFLGNEAVNNGAGQSMYYQNVLIEDNVLHTSHLHGIAVWSVDGLVVRNNTMLTAGNVNDGAERPGIRIYTDTGPVSITGNTAHIVPGTTPGWAVTGNTQLQHVNPGGANYYGSLDISSLMQPILQSIGSTITGTPVTPPPPTPPTGGGGTGTPTDVDWTAANDITGTSGQDQLRNTTEDDLMTGGADADRFSFHQWRAGDGDTDRITDLDFSDGDTLGIASFSDGYFLTGTAPLSTMSSGSGVLVRSIEDVIALADVAGVTVGAASDGATRIEFVDNKSFSVELATVSYQSLGLGGSVPPVVPPVVPPTDPGDVLVLPPATIQGTGGTDRLLDLAGDHTLSGLAGADRFSFYDGRATDGETNVVTDIDFSEGDSLALGGYGSGFFSSIAGEANVFRNGATVIIKSETELAALDQIAGITLEDTSYGTRINIYGQSNITIDVVGVDLSMFG